MLLLGSKAKGRHIEQHDVFFGIATSIKELVPLLKKFWPEAGNSLHVDGWREVHYVNGYKVDIADKHEAVMNDTSNRLFFINLGGYQPNKLEEQHYMVLTAQKDRGVAIQEAKKTVFYKTNTIKGTSANSHIDDKYGIDVDDIYDIEEMLVDEQKNLYHIRLTQTDELIEDKVNLGYYRMDKLLKML